MNHQRKVIVDGVEFDSITAASKALQIPWSTLKKRIRTSKPGYVAAPSKPNKNPVRINGVLYPHRNAACRALGIPMPALLRNLRKELPGWERVDATS